MLNHSFPTCQDGNYNETEWNKGYWAIGCDFQGNDLDEIVSSSSRDDCFEICLNKSDCTHFKWSKWSNRF